MFVSLLTALLTGSGASNVWFVGITIEAGRGDGISWTTADGLVLVNVTVKVSTAECILWAGIYTG